MRMDPCTRSLPAHGCAAVRHGRAPRRNTVRRQTRLPPGTSAATHCSHQSKSRRKRRRASQRRLATGATAAWSGDGEHVVREVCSEASIRASAGPAAEAPTLSPVLERLSRVIDAGLREDERQMLRWVSASIPQRVIAEWLGITHNAARVRVLRLRERLIELAVRGDAGWTPHQRQELYEFFRRSGLGERAARALRELHEPRPLSQRRPGRRKPSQEDQ